MKRQGNLWCTITKDLVLQATLNALKSKIHHRDVINFKKNLQHNVDIIYDRIKSEFYLKHSIVYSPLTKVSFTGKVRQISCCSLEWRIVMHVILLLIRPRFEKYIVDNVYNCIPGRGITSSSKRYSMVHKLKHDFYEKHEMQWYLKLDIKNCYGSTKPEVMWKAHERLFKDPLLLKHLRKVSMCNKGLPIGTPLSPTNHHIIMLEFDHLILEKFPDVVSYHRYADDVFIGCKTKEGAKKVLEFVKIYLKRELQYRLKKNIKLCPVRVPVDIGGYVFHRSEQTKNHHGKGYTTVRKTLKIRAKKRIEKSRESMASYFGLICHADSVNLWKVLTNNIKDLDFRNIAKTLKVREGTVNVPCKDVKTVLGKELMLISYELREPDKKSSPWVCLILGMKVSKPVANPFKPEYPTYKVFKIKGGYKYIFEFLSKLDKQIAFEAKQMGISFEERQRAYFPLEHLVLEDDGGIIFKDSVEYLEEVQESELSKYFPTLTNNSLGYYKDSDSNISNNENI